MLEVNHMPSFRADTEVDLIVKKNLIKNTLQILQLSLEQRRQMEEVLKKEKMQIQRGNIRRMTAQEHSQRVKFDYNLIDAYIPCCGYKRIYPLDPDIPMYSSTGEELQEVYNKMEKVAQTVWKKNVGMVSNKDKQPPDEGQKKKKRGKNKRHLLTSMTFRIKEKPSTFDNNVCEEEPPEDQDHGEDYNSDRPQDLDD